MKLLACLLLTLIACNSATSNTSAGDGKAPTQEEVRQYFFKTVKANADFYHHTNPTVVFTKYNQASPEPYAFSVGTKTCYAVKVDMFSSDDFEGTTFVATYTDDLYRFYRNDFGDLEIGNHVPGNLVSTTHPSK